MHPDFVFFHEVNGEVKASIVDPHGHHLEDAGMKLEALADFAEKYGDAFHRIEAVSQLANSLRVIDLTFPENRDAVRHGKPVIELYESIGVVYEVAIP